MLECCICFKIVDLVHHPFIGLCAFNALLNDKLFTAILLVSLVGMSTDDRCRIYYVKP